MWPCAAEVCWEPADRADNRAPLAFWPVVILSWTKNLFTLILGKIQTLLSLPILESAGQALGLSVTHLFFLESMNPDFSCDRKMVERLSSQLQTYYVFSEVPLLKLLSAPHFTRPFQAQGALLSCTWRHKNRNLSTFPRRTEGMCLLFVLIWVRFPLMASLSLFLRPTIVDTANSFVENCLALVCGLYF